MKPKKNIAVSKNKKQLNTTTHETKTLKWYILAIKFLFIFSIAVIAVVYTDRKGYFNPSQKNNHTQKKWDAFYDFTEKDTVDIVLVGNSHLYAGVNPKNLSSALGCNCFVLASPGTTIVDSYFCLKEALTRTKPKIAIIETYAINNNQNRLLKEGALSDQMKSFNARKNVAQKILSTPTLFSVENYLPAWSTTIRNHDFI